MHLKVPRNEFYIFIIMIAFIKISHQTEYVCNANATCGCSMNSAILSRIVGGEAASPETWSWAVSIKISDSNICAGSILSSEWILTAAHCVRGHPAARINVYAGSTAQWVGTQTRAVSKVIIHSKFDPFTYENDIALLKLLPPLVMEDSNLKLICLPSIDSETLLSGEWPAPETTVVAVGWGQLSEFGSVPRVLYQVTLETITYSAEACSKLVQNRSIQFCAGVPNGEKDTCYGDSGGPLMMFDSSKQWVLVGLTSYGYGCARPGYAGVYTRVAAYQDWINLRIAEETTTSTLYDSTTTTTFDLTSSFPPIGSHANPFEKTFFSVMLPLVMEFLVSKNELNIHM